MSNAISKTRKSLTMTVAAATATLLALPNAAQARDLTPAEALALFGGAAIIGGILLHNSNNSSSNTGAVTYHQQPTHYQPQVFQPAPQVQQVHHNQRQQQRQQQAQQTTRQALRQRARWIGYNGAKIQQFNNVYRENGRWVVKGVGRYNANARNPGPKFRFTAHVRRGQVLWLDTRPVRQQRPRYNQGYNNQGYNNQGSYNNNNGRNVGYTW